MTFFFFLHHTGSNHEGFILKMVLISILATLIIFLCTPLFIQPRSSLQTVHSVEGKKNPSLIFTQDKQLNTHYVSVYHGWNRLRFASLASPLLQGPLWWGLWASPSLALRTLSASVLNDFDEEMCSCMCSGKRMCGLECPRKLHPTELAGALPWHPDYVSPTFKLYSLRGSLQCFTPASIHTHASNSHARTQLQSECMNQVFE